MRLLLFTLLLQRFYANLSADSETLNLDEILRLDPGARLLAENLTISIPKKLIINGSEVVSNVIFSAKNIDYTFKRGSHKHNHSISHEYPRSIRDTFRLEDSIDPTLDPCDDFYSFVCSGWKKEHPIDETLYMISSTDQLGTMVIQQYYDLFQQPELFKLTRERQLMYQFYQKCIDKKERNDLGSKPLFEKLRKMRAANLPFLTDWLIFSQPEQVFFGISVEPNVYNSTFNTITISPQDPMLQIQYYTDPNYQGQLLEANAFLRQIFGFLIKDDVKREFFNGDEAEVDKKLQNFYYIDRKIGEIDAMFLDGNTTDITISLNELSELITTINYTRYLEAVIPREVMEKLDFSEMTVRVRNVDGIRLMNNVVHKVDNQTLADYLEGKMIFMMLPFLDDRFREAYDLLNQRVYGVTPKDSNEEDCIDQSITIFEDVASALYIERYFSQKSVDEVRMMVENIRNSFIEILEEAPWMDDQTKRAARVKAEKMSEFIGYNPKIFNQTAISEKYHLLEYPSPLTFQGITMALSKWNQQRVFQSLLIINSKDSFDFLASQVNAYYDPSRNQIAILAGILQAPFFDAHSSRVQNYGSIGVVIGHEITHGFDNYGAQFDEYGNKKNWWDEKTLENFEKMKQCFAGQYGSVKIDPLDIYINGYKTLGENIADNGGMRATLRALQKLIDKKQIDVENISTDLRKYSPIQIFFMSYGYSWCGNWRNETLLTEILEDTHSPDRARVNVVLGNSPEFAQAFNCPRTSNMVNKKRCRVW